MVQECSAVEGFSWSEDTTWREGNNTKSMVNAIVESRHDGTARLVMQLNSTQHNTTQLKSTLYMILSSIVFPGLEREREREREREIKREVLKRFLFYSLVVASSYSSKCLVLIAGV